MNLLFRALRPINFRGKYRLLDRLLPRSGTRTANLFGVRVRCDLSDLIQRQMYLGCYEPQETRTVRHLLRPGMTFVDAGANAGHFTLLAASLVGPYGRVLAFEPDPTLAEQLAAIAPPNTRVFAHALGRDFATKTLSIPPASFGNRDPVLVELPGHEHIRVKVAPLDATFDGKVDLLKLDVEGHEAEVIAGAARLLAAGRIRAVLCEFNDHWLRTRGTTPDCLWDTLLDHGLAPDRPRPRFAERIITVLFTRTRS
jgi:FkbM family methyltransferase